MVFLSLLLPPSFAWLLSPHLRLPLSLSSCSGEACCQEVKIYKLIILDAIFYLDTFKTEVFWFSKTCCIIIVMLRREIVQYNETWIVIYRPWTEPVTNELFLPVKKLNLSSSECASITHTFTFHYLVEVICNQLIGTLSKTISKNFQCCSILWGWRLGTVEFVDGQWGRNRFPCRTLTSYGPR